MSKSDKVNKTAGAAASRSKSAQKVLDIERRFIDDPIQVRFLLLIDLPGTNPTEGPLRPKRIKVG
jgi:hypothetical protein